MRIIECHWSILILSPHLEYWAFLSCSLSNCSRFCTHLPPAAPDLLDLRFYVTFSGLVSTYKFDGWCWAPRLFLDKFVKRSSCFLYWSWHPKKNKTLTILDPEETHIQLRWSMASISNWRIFIKKWSTPNLQPVLVCSCCKLFFRSWTSTNSNSTGSWTCFFASKSFFKLSRSWLILQRTAGWGCQTYGFSWDRNHLPRNYQQSMQTLAVEFTLFLIEATVIGYQLLGVSHQYAVSCGLWFIQDNWCFCSQQRWLISYSVIKYIKQFKSWTPLNYQTILTTDQCLTNEQLVAKHLDI